MKMVKWLMVCTLCLGMMTGSALALNLTGLDGVFDSITTLPNAGQSSVDVYNDYLAEGADANWAIGGSGGSIATIMIELAGNLNVNAFGVYDSANPGSFVQIFQGTQSQGAQAVLSIMANGMVRLNFVDTGVIFAGNNFGFYLRDTAPAGNGTFYSDTALNTDGLDHMLAYQGQGVDTIQIASLAPGIWAGNEWALAWEDLRGGGDLDYDDMVVMVESINPVPDGGVTAMLLGFALVGIGSLNRKFKSVK